MFVGGGGGEWSRRRPHFHCQCTHIHTGTLSQCICSVPSTDKEQCRRREEERKESQRPVPTEDRQRQLKSRRTVEGKQWCECWPPNETQLFSQIDIQCPIVSMRVCALVLALVPVPLPTTVCAGRHAPSRRAASCVSGH